MAHVLEADAAVPAMVARSEALPWRTIWREATVAWVISHVALVLVGALAILFVTARPTSGAHAVTPNVLTPSLFLSRWEFWDARNYLAIAQGDYPGRVYAAWLPLYPLTIRLVASVLPLGLLGSSGWLVAALVASNVAGLLALVLIGALVVHLTRYASITLPLALRLMVAWPFALFLAAPYSMSLLLACVAGALLAVLRDRWGWAAVCAFLAAFTHPLALALLPALAWEAWRRRRLVWLLPPGAVGLAWATYLGYSFLHWHDALAFLHIDRGYGRVPLAPWQTAVLVWTALRASGLGSYAQAHLLLEGVPFLLAILLTTFLALTRRLPGLLLWYTAGVLLLCWLVPLAPSAPAGCQAISCLDPLAAIGRYLLAAFPLPIALAQWVTQRPRERDGLAQGLVLVGAMLQALLLAVVLTGGWLI